MTRADISAIVYEMVAESFELPQNDITPATSADEVPAWDSLQHTILLIRLQNRFAIEFQPRRAPSARRVGAVVDAVCAACGAV